MSDSKKAASSNWFALQKTLEKKSSSDSTASLASNLHRHKRRKLSHVEQPTTKTKSTSPTPSIASTSARAILPDEQSSSSATSPILVSLRGMVNGSLEPPSSQTQPGKYLAIDCEMVGVGPEGTESSLARVSLVNWYGAIQLDVFVRQRERIVDYRTRWSGIRERDMVGAKPFKEVQKQVADLVKDRILVGHAVHNDLKALLLSHPHTLLRDTQVYARKFNLTKSKYIALRHLVKEQIGVTIQEGEHSSVTDARATMAIYRLHKKEWEKGVRPIEAPTTSTKRKRGQKDKERAGVGDNSPSSSPNKKAGASTPPSKSMQNHKQKVRKNISSGLSTVIRHHNPNNAVASKTIVPGKSISSTARTVRSGEKDKSKNAWWTELPNLGGTRAKRFTQPRLS